jgi:hypothetical protein
MFLTDLDVLWDNEERRLLGKNYFKYSKFSANCRGMLLREPTP